MIAATSIASELVMTITQTRSRGGEGSDSEVGGVLFAQHTPLPSISSVHTHMPGERSSAGRGYIWCSRCAARKCLLPGELFTFAALPVRCAAPRTRTWRYMEVYGHGHGHDHGHMHRRGGHGQHCRTYASVSIRTPSRTQVLEGMSTERTEKKHHSGNHIDTSP